MFLEIDDHTEQLLKEYIEKFSITDPIQIELLETLINDAWLGGQIEAKNNEMMLQILNG